MSRMSSIDKVFPALEKVKYMGALGGYWGLRKIFHIQNWVCLRICHGGYFRHCFVVLGLVRSSGLKCKRFFTLVLLLGVMFGDMLGCVVWPKGPQAAQIARL